MSSQQLCMGGADTPLICLDREFICFALFAAPLIVLAFILVHIAVTQLRNSLSSSSDFEPLKMTPEELLRVLESTRPDLSERERTAWAGRAGKSIFEQQASKARGRDSDH